MIMGVVFVLLIAYPFIEQKVTGDHAHHNLLQRPRDVPVRTAIGAMAIAFYIVLTFSAMNDIIAYKFHISLNATTWIGRIGMVVLPAIVYYITYRWCVGLQRSDRAVLEHGIETGIIKRLPTVPTSSCISRSARSTTTVIRFRWSTRALRCPSG